MNALTVARKEITDVRRSYLIWALLAILGLYTLNQLLQFSAETFVGRLELERSTPFYLSFVSTIVVPYVAILTGGMTIVGEEESGSIRVALSHPVSRLGFLVGKSLGRAIVLIGVISLGVIFGSLGIYIVVNEFSIVGVLQAVAFASLYGLAYFGIAVGFSAIASTRLRSLALSFGVYLFFSSYWRQFFMDPLFRWIEGRPPTEATFNPLTPSSLHWYLQINRVNPENAFSVLTVLSEGPNWFAIGVLLFWTVAPMMVGYGFLRNRDVSRGGA